ncbi:ribonuclease H-like domain-containing protein [Tanacetum coccineum]
MLTSNAHQRSFADAASETRPSMLERASLDDKLAWEELIDLTSLSYDKLELVDLIIFPVLSKGLCMHTRSQSRNSNRQQQQVPPTFVEPFNLVEPIENQAPPVVTMDDNRTMAQLLEAPTVGYEDAIVVPEITADNFELKHDFITRWVLLRCDSTGDLYHATKPFPLPCAFLTSQTTWHQQLGHLESEVLCHLTFRNLISCNKEKPLVLYHACQLGKHVRLPFLDVKNAFLHDALSETVYMHQPPGFRDSAHPDYVYLLQRHGTDIAYLLLYVDDIVVIASSDILLQQIIASLHQEFSMTDLGSLNYFMGISVTRDSSEMILSQRKYATQILERAHMVNCNPNRTPVDTESKLGDHGDPVSDPTLYRSLAGSLQYLTFTRPNISYAVQQVCLYMNDHREPHFLALKRILRYVRGTLDHGLQLFSSSTSYLVAYSDADWAVVLLLDDQLRVIVAEAAYRGVANAVAETCWLRNLLSELHTPLSSATLVYCDNVSAVYLSYNLVQHQRTKHIEIDIHFVQDFVVAGQVRVLHVSSRYQYANIFTKGLLSTLFEKFRASLSVRCPPAQTAKEC